MFAQNSSLRVNNIIFTNLKATKEFVIYNELNFKKGDIIFEHQLDSILQKQVIQLYNLQLFHWVKYAFVKQKNEVNIEFIFQERWYLWPIPIFSLADRNISSWIQNWDFNRLDYGLHLVHYNFRGKNETVKSNIQLGYNQKYELFYNIPYIDKNQLLGLNLGFSHYRSHYALYDLDKGIPLYKEFLNQFAIKNTYVKAGVFRRKNVHNIANFNLETHSLWNNDSLIMLNSTYFNDNSRNNYLTFEIAHTLNHRNTFSYPTSGYFLQYKLAQRIGVTSNHLNLSELNLNVAIYQPISKKITFSSGISSAIRLSKQNYFLDQQILGYKNFVRGFEYYVTQGNAMILHKSGLNLSMLENKNIKLKPIKSSKFNTVPISIYLNAFLDWAYVSNNELNINNILANKIQLGKGIGIHLVTYYDRVLVFEYSFNNLGKNGFFITNKFPF